MKLIYKRTIFWFLFLSFFVYSFVVYTSGTDYDREISHFTEEAKQGKEVFQKYNCIACHQFYGLGGYMGPDLTNVISDPNKGSNYAKAFIQSGTAKMPRFDMEEAELDALLAYLKYIGKAANYPDTNARSTWYGTIESLHDGR